MPVSFEGLQAIRPPRQPEAHMLENGGVCSSSRFLCEMHGCKLFDDLHERRAAVSDFDRRFTTLIPRAKATPFIAGSVC
jgi:hypothetical protein